MTGREVEEKILAYMAAQQETVVPEEVLIEMARTSGVSVDMLVDSLFDLEHVGLLIESPAGHYQLTKQGE